MFCGTLAKAQMIEKTARSRNVTKTKSGGAHDLPPQLPASGTVFVMQVSQHGVQHRQFRSAQAQELHRVSDDKRSEPTDGRGIRRLKFSNNVAASERAIDARGRVSGSKKMHKNQAPRKKGVGSVEAATEENIGDVGEYHPPVTDVEDPDAVDAVKSSFLPQPSVVCFRTPAPLRCRLSPVC